MPVTRSTQLAHSESTRSDDRRLFTGLEDSEFCPRRPFFICHSITMLYMLHLSIINATFSRDVCRSSIVQRMFSLLLLLLLLFDFAKCISLYYCGKGSSTGIGM